MVTQLVQVQVPTVFVSHLNTMYPDHGQSHCYSFCEYRQQQYTPYYIGPNTSANTFIQICISGVPLKRKYLRH